MSIWDCCDECTAPLSDEQLKAPLLLGGRYCDECAAELRAANPDHPELN